MWFRSSGAAFSGNRKYADAGKSENGIAVADCGAQ